MADRPALPGHVLDAERSVLAALLADPTCAITAATELTHDHFYSDAHRKLFRAMVAIGMEAGPMEAPTILARADASPEIAAALRVTLADVMSTYGVSSNLPAYAAIVRADWQRRERIRLARALEQVADDPEAAASVHHQLATVEATGTARDARWAEQALTGRDLLTREFPATESLVGEGLIARTSFNLLAGAAGTGKTFLALQLAHAIASGRDWLGHATTTVRVGFLELEMTWAAMQARVRSLMHPNDPDSTRLSFLCMPVGGSRLTDRQVRARLTAFIRDHDLALLVCDPLNRVNSGSMDRAHEISPLLEVVHEIRAETGCAFLFNHHVRKGQQGQDKPQSVRIDSLHSLSGSHRLGDDADTVMHLDEARGHLRLTFAKVRLGICPEDSTWLTRTENGFFEVAEDPDVVVDVNRVRVEQLLAAAGEVGVTAAEVAQAIGLTPRTATKYLALCGANQVQGAGGRRSTRWVRHDEPLSGNREGY